MSIIRPAPDRRKPWRAPDRCKIMWATAAALQSPYPLACSVLIADKYQDRAFDWHFRRIRRHLRKALGQQPAVLVVQHNRPQTHVHLSLAAYSESEVPLIEDALRDAVGDWGSSRGEVYQVEIRPLYSVGLDPDIETLIGGKPKPNTPGWGRYMRRWLVERFFAWIQWQRRILVCWEYHTENNFLGFVQLGCLVILFRRF